MKARRHFISFTYIQWYSIRHCRKPFKFNSLKGKCYKNNVKKLIIHDELIEWQNWRNESKLNFRQSLYLHFTSIFGFSAKAKSWDCVDASARYATMPLNWIMKTFKHTILNGKWLPAHSLKVLKSQLRILTFYESNNWINFRIIFGLFLLKHMRWFLLGHGRILLLWSNPYAKKNKN